MSARYVCNVCHRDYAKAEHLVRHTRTHTGAKPYPCLTCGRAFARQDSLSRHTKVHDNPAKRRRSSAIDPLTPIAPAGPSTEHASQASNTAAVVDQPQQYTITAGPDFFTPTNHYQSNQYQTVMPDAQIDPMLMHDPTVMPVTTQQHQSVSIDPMLSDDFATFAADWHQPKSMPTPSVSQAPGVWAGDFAQEQPQIAMMSNPYYAPDGLSMQSIRDQQRTEWPQQGQHQS